MRADAHVDVLDPPLDTEAAAGLIGLVGAALEKRSSAFSKASVKTVTRRSSASSVGAGESPGSSAASASTEPARAPVSSVSRRGEASSRLRAAPRLDDRIGTAQALEECNNDTLLTYLYTRHVASRSLQRHAWIRTNLCSQISSHSFNSYTRVSLARAREGPKHNSVRHHGR